jgi:hypothetical protein
VVRRAEAVEHGGEHGLGLCGQRLFERRQLGCKVRPIFLLNRWLRLGLGYRLELWTATEDAGEESSSRLRHGLNDWLGLGLRLGLGLHDRLRRR